MASLGAVLAFIDATIVNIAFPDIRNRSRGRARRDLSWVLNAYNIVFAAFLVAAGRIADLLGRKRLFEWGCRCSRSRRSCARSPPTLGLLVAARVIQALGAAILVPASLALVLAGRSRARSARHAVALWSASAALAAGIGPSARRPPRASLGAGASSSS